MKLITLFLISALPIVAEATGMAVSLDNLYLQNNTNKSTVVQVKNLDESTNQITLPAHGICKIKQSIMFQPFSEESNNFVIMVSNDGKINPIVIDQFGLLTLASDSAIKAQYSGNVKMYSLLGFCGDQLGQYKFMNVLPHDNESAAPNFTMVNCKQSSNFVYFINDQYIKVKNRPKKIDFDRVGECSIGDGNK